MRDRYAIYDMIGKVVRFRLPLRLGGKIGDGLVSEVYRDVLEHKIEITIGSKTYVFREPNSVEREDEDNAIMFVYGNQDPVTDAQFQEEHHKANIAGQGTEEAFKALDRDYFTVMFQLYTHQTVMPSRKRSGKKRKR
jgi:hypothetical protein